MRPSRSWLPGLLLASAVLGGAGPAPLPPWSLAVSFKLHVTPDGLFEADEVYDVLSRTAAMARANGQQTYRFSADQFDAAVTEAWTQKADGTRIPVRPDAVVEQGSVVNAAAPLYTGDKALAILFPALEAGDTTHYAIHLKRRATDYPGWFTTNMSPAATANLTSMDVTVTLPPEMTVLADPRNLAEDAPQTGPSGAVVRHWHLQPGEGRSWARAALGLSDFPNWAALGQAYADGFAASAQPTEAVRAMAEQVTAGVADRREQARLLYEWVTTHIRYVGIGVGRTRIVPHTAAEVLEVRYGDCKDGAALLAALLAVKGIAAEPVLTGLSPVFGLADVPTMGQLNHALLRLPDWDTYVDVTVPRGRFGVLPWADHDKPAVLSTTGGVQLVRTPALRPETNQVALTTVVTIDPEGRVSGTTETAATGTYGLALQEYAAGAAAKGTALVAGEQLRALGSPGTGSMGPVPAGDRPGAFALRGQFSLADRVPLDGQGFTIPAGLPVSSRPGSGLLGSELTLEGGHTCYAATQREDLRLRVPAGLMPDSLPDPVTVAAGMARYESRYAWDDGAVTVRRSFVVDTPGQFCTQAEYAAMQPAVRAALQDAGRRIVLVPVRRHHVAQGG